MTARSIVCEAIAPRRHVYYHGTSHEARGRQILVDKVLRPGVSSAEPPRVQKMYHPQPGRVYVTRDLCEAVVNALGGIKMGHDWSHDENDRYGYLFQVHLDDPTDTTPDEDTVGEIAYDLMAKKSVHGVTSTIPPWLQARLKRSIELYLSPQQLDRLRDYSDFGHLTVAGKKLITAWERHDPRLLQLISLLTPNLALRGELRVTAAWKIDKNRSAEILPDARNFFSIAERVQDQ